MDVKKFNGTSWETTPSYVYKTATDTITTLPATIYADGTAATIGLKGNTVQSGTPTPQNPVDVVGVGERTANLFDYTVSESGTITATGVLEPNVNCWRSTIYYEIDETKTYRASKAKDTIRICYYDSSKTFISREQITAENNKIITIPSGAKYIKWTLFSAEGFPDLAAVGSMKIMLSEGAEIISYQPYGYKIPISSANTTTNIYLGEVQSTRNIIKYVLTGQENWVRESGNTYALEGVEQTAIGYRNALCTHYVLATSYSTLTGTDGTFSVSRRPALFIHDENFTAAAQLKTYLATQYANGTPVTIFYALNTSTTGIVNEPLQKIGDYADSISGISIPTTDGANALSIGTTVQPSEVTAAYHGWHTGTVHERESGAWD